MSIKALFTTTVATLVAIAASGCATETASTASLATLAEARQQLSASIGACTRQYGYDAAKVAAIAQNVLATNELQWRQCVYAALRSYARTNSAMTARYESLITEDMAMTMGIRSGTMTRSQRKARIEQLTAEIRLAEDQQIAATHAQQQLQARQMENTISAIRSLGN